VIVVTSARLELQHGPASAHRTIGHSAPYRHDRKQRFLNQKFGDAPTAVSFQVPQIFSSREGGMRSVLAIVGQLFGSGWSAHSFMSAPLRDDLVGDDLCRIKVRRYRMSAPVA
jgi:hypothetical protein